MPIFSKAVGLWESKAEPTRAELQEQQRAQDFVTERLEVSFGRRVAFMLNRSAVTISSNAAKFGQDVMVEPEMQKLAEDLVPEFENQYRRTATTFQRDLIDGLEKSYGVFETKDQGGIFQSLLAQYIADNAAAQVQHVVDTTRVLINGAISQAVEENLGPAGMAKLIRMQAGGMVSLDRSRTIARTETHSAAQFGQSAAAESTGLQFRKYWVDARDERTRTDHIKAGKDSRDEVVMRSEPFNVGGEALMFPGDPSGSAEQIINCRCVAVYRPII
jgi:hypothetical protein